MSLVLASQPPADISKDNDKKAIIVEHWLGKRATGVRNTVQGAILTAAALLIGIALALFSGKSDWIIIWTIFFGWMAGWGIVSLALGLGAVMESKTMSRQNELAGGAVATTPKRLTTAGDLNILVDASTTPELILSASVTEHTTEPLIKVPLTSKDG